MTDKAPIRTQALRFTVVGVASNLLLYLLYLLLTWLGIGHKSAMTSLYLLGVLQTFVFNRSWSFQHTGRASFALGRYAVVYAAGYLLNLSLLWVAVDLFHLPHQGVQALAIVLVAASLFIMNRYWVFAPPLRSSAT